MPFHLFAAFALMWLGIPALIPQGDPVDALVLRLEQALRTGDTASIRQLAHDEKAVAELVDWFGPDSSSRVVLKLRDRTSLPTGGQRLLVEAFSEKADEGRLVTFIIEVGKKEDGLRIAAASRIANVGGLFRLSLNSARQYDVRNLTLRAPDLTLFVPSGTAFVAETPEGPTAVVLLGKGEMLFSPPDAAERTQVRIFSGAEALKDQFDGAFVRVRPADFALRFPKDALVERAVSQSDYRRALGIFDQYIGRTLQIDLGDLSAERWSITPQPGDLIAEIRTKDHGSLTYTRASDDLEDVTLFDRARRKNISVYASREKLATRGRFYSEDDVADYDVLVYDVDVKVSPEQSYIEGSARLRLKVRSPGLAIVSMRLAEALAVRGVYSPEHGRLLHLRVVGQNSLIVSLPVTLSKGSEVWLTVLYAGRVPPQELDREAIQLTQEDPGGGIPPEARYLYSHRAYWYPQPVVTDYALARVSVSLPPDYDAVATGSLKAPPTIAAGVVDPGERERRRFVFESERPVRYLALVMSRLRPVNSRQVDDVTMTVVANVRQVGRARSMSARAEDIFRFYKSLIGRAPYPTFTLAFTERETPGGHSPAYFAVVDQVPHTTKLTWRNDPVNFESYPAFFVAHEIAHQWWGQAVGWKNYHEQWISEGFAQYFALLYAERNLDDVAPNVLRRMRQTAISQSPQGPVYLGYRLGHIKGQTAVFRSIIYNKSAMVLHMLRRLIGDEAFFKGVRAFYDKCEFDKAGTGDFLSVMEQVSGRPLGRFFDAWIFGIVVPEVTFTSRVNNDEAVVRFEQHGEPVEIPITVTIAYGSGKTQEVVIAVADKVTEQKIALSGPVRSIAANTDHGALAVIR